MGEGLLLKTGGGLDTDDLTATAADVRRGKLAGVHGSDDPVEGTLDIVAADILAGRSIGGVAGTATNDSNAVAANLLSGKTAYAKGQKITGTIPVRAGAAINPGASRQTVACAGKYMTADVIVNSVSGLTAANIKKGVVIGGVTGTFEGWVASTDDIYKRGSFGAGCSISNFQTCYESGRIGNCYAVLTNNNIYITIGNGLTDGGSFSDDTCKPAVIINKAINLAKYKTITATVSANTLNQYISVSLGVSSNYTRSLGDLKPIGSGGVKPEKENTEYTVKLDVSSITTNGYIYFSYGIVSSKANDVRINIFSLTLNP